jgi:hypothetical protein
MCALCGLLGSESHWAGSIRGNLPARQERLRRILQANRVLSFYRLRLDDFQGSSYVLTSATGRSEIVADFGQVWRAAEQMAGRPLDPLDPKLLSALEGSQP